MTVNVKGNTIYVGDVAVAVIFDAAPAEARAELLRQLKRLESADRLDDARGAILGIAGHVKTLAEAVQADGYAADIENMIG